MRCKVRIFGHTGNLIAESEASSVESGQQWAEKNHPNGSVVIRGTETSDGSIWPGFNGRMLACREAGMWFRD